MQSRQTIVAAALLAVVAVSTLSCEDTDLTAPSDGQIFVTANPGNVIIDVEAGEETGDSTIVAQVLDVDGAPLQGVSVIFTTDGGVLRSSDNRCQAGQCKISGEGCSDDGDCVAQLISVKTNSSGIATDLLTLSQADPSTITVEARSASVIGRVEVTKTLDEGNILPTAVIFADPQNEQQKGLLVTFDALDSDDPDGQITCYRWRITSTKALDNIDLQCTPPSTKCEIVQGTTEVSVPRTYEEEQELTVDLAISDDPDVTMATCPRSGPVADDSLFTATDTLSGYQIICDKTDPVANAGNDQSITLGTPAMLDGSLSGDPDSPTLQYFWECGGGSSPNQTSPVATCNYSPPATQTFTAKLTVTNVCGLQDDDTVNITVTVP